jgi:hypothetical protein
MAAIYSNGGNRWNILGFNSTKRDALSSVYKISMVHTVWQKRLCFASEVYTKLNEVYIGNQAYVPLCI